LAAVLSLSANAWVGDLVLSDKRDRPQAAIEVAEMRELDEEATGVLLERISGHADTLALRDILLCYRRALAFWGPEQQSAALAHLHTGLLAMSEVLIRHLAESHGIGKAGIARMFAVSPADLPARVLETEIYRDDTLCLHAARLASDAASA